METGSCICHRPDLRSCSGICVCLGCGTALGPEAVSSHQLEVDEDTHVGLSTEDAGNLDDNNYSYSPLDRASGRMIRLLLLYPGKYADEIVCRVFQVDLDADPDYEAISYTWGDNTGEASRSRSIRCPRSVLLVTTNCEMALRRIRHPGFTRTIWIDSICINQENVQERNHQVSMMKDIYSSASRVLIYTGEASKNSNHLLGYIGDLGQPRHRYLEKGSGSPLALEEIAREMYEFLSRPWFHRVWVLQETLLAKSAIIIAGEKAIDWVHFSIDRLNELGIQPVLPDGSIPSIFRWTQLQAPNVDLLLALHTSRNCLATDIRDKVFAVLSLLTDPSHTKITPDYGLSAEQVFVRTAASIIMAQNSLDVLSYIEPSERQLALPSWVPDWSVTAYLEPFAPHFEDTGSWNGTFDSESQGTAVKLSSLLGDNWPFLSAFPTLSVWATKLDTVKELVDYHYASPQYSKELVDYHYASPRSRYTGQIQRSVYQGPSGGHVTAAQGREISTRLLACPHPCLRKDAFFKAIIGTQLSFRHERTFHYNDYPSRFKGSHLCSCDSCELRATCRRCNKQSLNIRPMVYNKAKLRSFERQLQLHRPGRVVFETSQSFGIGPRSLQRGDTVWQLRGAKIPFVLREDGQYFKVVGECYLQDAAQWSATAAGYIKII